ncbi:MAG: sigma-54-dependent Fis family transcriptional regulator [Calditrichaeota bacterium]|nr:sigma-54-dependent Fis family transcriptional regulator [Calditrichota bacterium]
MSVKNPYQTLLRISEQMNSIHDINMLLDRIMDSAMEALSAERGFILLKNADDDNQFTVVTARNITRETIDSIRGYSSSVVNRVLETGKAILSIDAQADERFAGSESIIMQQIKSVICTPLIFNGRIMAAIYMDSRASVRQFDQESLEFLKAFATQATIALNNARMFERLQLENQKLKRQISLSQSFPEIIGKSEPMLKILEMIRDVADASASVMIEGESGTGKELVARALHYHSTRKDKAFIPIFCGSLSENLLESELFGHKKGSFTGATENKRGLFEEADGGTLFLDEIADVSPTIQTRLLRVLQEGEFKRVGENQIRTADVRIIAATNKDLWEEVRKGNFREDLYYRLNVINIKMPPLRHRKSDIPLLAEHFLKHYALKNKKNITGFTKEAFRYLQEYEWPGNVRELENAIERAVILTRKPEIDVDLFNFRKADNKIPIGKTLKEITRYAVLETIKMTGGNRTKAAEILGVSRRWLHYHLKEWGMIDGA